ncbi:GPO family capsid scaffolding protein [Salmonella enterica]|uniref:GPO family capsid scaffolding protein n=1 Tax=Salmonella enterica TaxID=28901 RepID=UPI00126FDDA0|nr:GPO family capsid scaffolding protein [Salmonella enterica]ECE6695706.1 phage capsid protein [Salmonella enterica subsp. diarizonae]ECJ2361579.1 GPO family capsid scaffolding protein [Salmonella enterica subsp. diarizonae]ECJ2411435.1 GPO family capsid scaffolding protein [Salmonella enterica subsp. diarizonae]EDU3628353.1 GPO family capsid scaffolding protein [Salmonella enterica]
MGSANKPARKKFRVAVSGSTIDGREISGELLKAAAKNYDPTVYGARVNVEHIKSIFPNSELCAMGDVTALSTEDITEGPLAGRVALNAEIEPTDRMKELTDEGKKIYSSIELYPDALDGKPYIMGLAMTDTPASLGTERLKFAAQQREQVMKFSNQHTEAPMFTEAMEAEIIELAEQRSEEGKQWFSRVMELIGKGRKSDGEQFSQVREAMEGVAQSHADLLDRFNDMSRQYDSDHKTIEKLSTELTTLRNQLASQDGDTKDRFRATGGNAAEMPDF